MIRTTTVCAAVLTAAAANAGSFNSNFVGGQFSAVIDTSITASGLLGTPPLAANVEQFTIDSLDFPATTVFGGGFGNVEAFGGGSNFNVAINNLTTQYQDFSLAAPITGSAQPLVTLFGSPFGQFFIDLELTNLGWQNLSVTFSAPQAATVAPDGTLLLPNVEVSLTGTVNFAGSAQISAENQDFEDFINQQINPDPLAPPTLPIDQTFDQTIDLATLGSFTLPALPFNAQLNGDDLTLTGGIDIAQLALGAAAQAGIFLPITEADLPTLLAIAGVDPTTIPQDLLAGLNLELAVPQFEAVAGFQANFTVPTPAATTLFALTAAAATRRRRA